MAAAIQMDIAPKVLDYVKRVTDLGVMQGSLGQKELNPKLILIRDALHHVLAGGEVADITFVQQGDQDLVDELNTLMKAAYDESNAINKEAGMQVVIEL